MLKSIQFGDHFDQDFLCNVRCIIPMLHHFSADVIDHVIVPANEDLETPSISLQAFYNKFIVGQTLTTMFHIIVYKLPFNDDFSIYLTQLSEPVRIGYVACGEGFAQDIPDLAVPDIRDDLLQWDLRIFKSLLTKDKGASK